jgi:hypothetical protein
MHARFELPSSMSGRTVLALRVATRQAQSVEVIAEAGDRDVGDSGVVGAVSFVHRYPRNAYA